MELISVVILDRCVRLLSVCVCVCVCVVTCYLDAHIKYTVRYYSTSQIKSRAINR